MKPTTKTINGVDVDSLKETIGAIRKDPEMAKCKFRVSNHWIKGAHNQATVEDFYGAHQEISHKDHFKVEIDEPPILLGEDFGPNPTEHVLAALSGCLTTSLIYHAAAQGIEIEEVESEFEGDLDLRGFLGLDENVRNGYQDIRVKFRVKADASREEIDRLIELAKARSPVFDIVSNPVKVTVTGEKMRGSMH